MTGADLAKAIGRTGSCRFEKVRVDVRITNARSAYGRHDVEVTPIAGSGSMWVEVSRVLIDPVEAQPVPARAGAPWRKST